MLLVRGNAVAARLCADLPRRFESDTPIWPVLPLDCVLDVSWDPQKRDHVEIDIILSPRQAKAFRDRINKDGSDARAIDGALENVKSEEAEASVQADLKAIRALIGNTSGSFGTINATVKQFLRRWFVSQGGVKVVARKKRGYSIRDSGPPSGHSASRSIEGRYISVEQNTGPGPETGDAYAEYLVCEESVRSTEVTITKEDGEAWGIGVRVDPAFGVVVTKVEPGGVGARHKLAVGMTFPTLDGADATKLSKKEVLHALKTKSSFVVATGPILDGEGSGSPGPTSRPTHYYPD